MDFCGEIVAQIATARISRIFLMIFGRRKSKAARPTLFGVNPIDRNFPGSNHWLLAGDFPLGVTSKTLRRIRCRFRALGGEFLIERGQRERLIDRCAPRQPYFRLQHFARDAR